MVDTHGRCVDVGRHNTDIVAKDGVLNFVKVIKKIDKLLVTFSDVTK